jgi:hypothetical protein
MGIIKDRLLGAVGHLTGGGEDAAGEPSCAFCGKPAEGVKHLIAGPQVMICDECVAICAGVLADKDEAWRTEALRLLSERVD